MKANTAPKHNGHELSLAPLIVEGERLIKEACAYYKLETKPENIVLTIQTRGKRESTLGWFWAKRWKKDKKDPVHEINLSAETLATNDAGETLIHELAHAENETKGIKDVSNRVHNKHFKAMAEHLGLKVLERDKSVGFGFTELDKGAKDFLEKINFSRAIFDRARLTPTGRKKVGSRLIKCVCPDCEYTVRTTQKWLDIGLPQCPDGNEMQVED